MTVVTRFAPSPTGFLHIGGARTALFNFLFARRHGGRFLLRVEDTDRRRSTEEAVEAIFDGLDWLGIEWDSEPVYQSRRKTEHLAAAHRLLGEGNAYRCYATPEELAEMRETARKEGRPRFYDGRWRDRDPGDAPPGVDPVIRFKAPHEGETVIEDAVQGRVRVANPELDDIVLVRADGTPTYTLAVVVDDHDMGVTDAIRGDDHLTNAFRQTALFRALGWAPPRYAHIPLIHGADGAKLSKRHGALAVEAYREMGILPEALNNGLLRLGWSHGNDEVISREEAIAWFDLDKVGRAASRFDMDRLLNLNGHYIQHCEATRLIAHVRGEIERRRGATLDAGRLGRLELALPSLRKRAKTIVELTDKALFYVLPRPLTFDDKARKLLADAAPELIADMAEALAALPGWTEEAIEGAVRGYAERRALKLGAAAQPLRAALTGSAASPGIFEVATILGRDETLGRLRDALGR